MIRVMKLMFIATLLPAVLVLALACGGGNGKDDTASDGGFAVGRPAVAPSEEQVVREVIKEVSVQVEKEVVLERMVVTDESSQRLGFQASSVPVVAKALVEDQGPSTATTGVGSTEQQAALVSQQRIIVRTVDMGLVVNDVPGALDRVRSLAEGLGGWLVSSDRSQKHRGFISVRVPAGELDGAIDTLRDLAVEVEREISTSRDVTDEYVDVTARLSNLDVTHEALVKLLERADDVEDALGVQRELTRVQEEIERLQGRIKFLEETAAFSLVNVSLRRSPVDMVVDAGADMTFSVGEVARFRASFEPPEDIDEFEFTWDFGDGSPPIRGTRTARSAEDDDTRFTATVTHVYRDDRDSPFIAEIKLTGTGDAGVAEGEATTNITVTRLPVVEVFAGESMTVEDGDDVEFIGSFTRPEALADVRFRWEFGDGTPPVIGTIDEGLTRAVATHAYADHRAQPYTATLTITAQSEAGEVEAQESLFVLVTESEGWTISGWSAGDSGRTAVRALSGVGQALGTFFIWLGIFSPIWIIGGILGVVAVRRVRRRSASG